MRIENMQRVSDLMDELEEYKARLRDVEEFLKTLLSADYRLKPIVLASSLKAYLQLPISYTLDLEDLPDQDKKIVIAVFVKYLKKEITNCKHKIDGFNDELLQL